MRKALYIIVTAALFLVFICLGATVFFKSYLRLKETLIDLYGAFSYYVFVIFYGKTHTLPSVLGYSEVIKQEIISVADIEKTLYNAGEFIKLFVSKDNFTSWLSSTGKSARRASKIFVLLIPCIVGLIVIVKRIYGSTNAKHNEDTLALKLFKGVTGITYLPIKRFITGYAEFLKDRPWIWKLWIAIWVFNLNFASIIVAFLAYYFYFAAAFEVKTLYLQAVKLLFDLQVFLMSFPRWSLIIIAYIIFNSVRKKIATKKLRRFEARNCGFINELPIVSMTVGSMGKKKTTMITDMTLSQEVMFRQKALDIIQKSDMKFPFFPWICFENELLNCMEYGTVYNLATVKEWVKKKRERYNRHGYAKLQLYGYDVNRYGDKYHDGLKENDLFDVLETYAMAYFIYAIETSLIVSNYSVRTDNEKFSIGNFPLWNLDFYSRKGSNGYSHILDFDVLRLGKKVIEGNRRAGSFEFGVVAITEIGKERGNVLELKEIKKNTEETNQKNDLFNTWLKMCRHSATVDNFPFIKVFTDEQRPESWGADARDLCEIIQIVKSGEMRLALPFYTLEEMLSECAFNRFIALYYDFRYRRGDNTLLVHILKLITEKLWKRNVKFYNEYGYSVLRIEKKSGTMDGKKEKKKY